MKKIYGTYCLIQEVICGILFFSIVALVFSSSFMRLFNHPLIWADDIAKLFFAWVALLGADVAMRRCRLVGVDMLVNTFKPRLNKIVHLIGYLVMIAILIIFVYYGFRLSFRSWDRFFQTIPISYSYVTLCLPIGSLCMILTAGIKAYKLIRHLNDDAWSLNADAVSDDPGDVGVCLTEPHLTREE